MNYELIVTPGGHLRVRESHDIGGTEPDAWIKRVAAFFSESEQSGLFALAAGRPGIPPGPRFSYWRDFSSLFLTRFCRTPRYESDETEPLDPPAESELFTFLLSAPPMPGGEYLSAEVLRRMWCDLDAWVGEEVAAFGAGSAGWLKKNAPAWQQVGRVCLHLAENKRDSELPFAFMATYAPALSKRGQVQYKALGKALHEYAGEGNRPALINLLSPVQRAAEKVEFVEELVESGDIYYPLAWTPAEAYRLLENVPLLEESGLLVRLPDWWRKRPRARVSVTIGESRQSSFGADAMMDFNVGIALGDEQLGEEEWRRILSSEDGLVYVKGRWIEVDRDKLSEVLEHWKRIEADASEGGISFIEGMRLLAGAPADLNGDGSGGDEEREWSFVEAGSWLSSVLSNL
ncbi:MAG: SNF2 helicase-associated domain-containing protein, partial [Spirochaetales bacterium]|nr:SNF2 helicase-associated domain-containing protein [Spirochaetales bacterium]